jgi:hypothetical protein
MDRLQSLSGRRKKWGSRYIYIYIYILKINIIYKYKNY